MLLSIVGEALKDARMYGWEFDDKVQHNWVTLRDNVQCHIASLNWNYKTQLRTKNVKYINSLGEFVDSHTIKTTNTKGVESLITGARIVIAVGGRPKYPDVPGAREYAITSDDLFSMNEPPGKTLVVGASYVALECAGFLAKFGFETCCMVRSILLRGFDQQMADSVGSYMTKNVTFLHKCVPTKVRPHHPLTSSPW
jgi:thioredoxin reductase (NADPH)